MDDLARWNRFDSLLQQIEDWYKGLQGKRRATNGCQTPKGQVPESKLLEREPIIAQPVPVVVFGKRSVSVKRCGRDVFRLSQSLVREINWRRPVAGR